MSDPEVHTEDVSIAVPSGEQMPCFLARPASREADSRQLAGRQAPGVLIAHDIFGRGAFYEGLAVRLAKAGFDALLPDYFFRQGPLAERKLELALARRARLDAVQTLADLGAAIAWLRAQPGRADQRLGSLGFCMAGTMTFDLAADHSNLATVCYYGFVTTEDHPIGRAAPLPMDLVDRMQGPILAFWGDQDEGVGMHNVAEFVKKIEQQGTDFHYKIYPGLGHAFLANSGLDPKHPTYEAAMESWETTLAFFRDHLMGSQAA